MSAKSERRNKRSPTRTGTAARRSGLAKSAFTRKNARGPFSSKAPAGNRRLLASMLSNKVCGVSPKWLRRAISNSMNTCSRRSPSNMTLCTPSMRCSRSRTASASRLNSRAGKPGAVSASSEKYTSAKSSLTSGPITPGGKLGASSCIRRRTS